MGSGVSTTTATGPQRQPPKCPRHPNGNLTYFDKTNDRLICQYCRKSIGNRANVVNVRTFVNEPSFSEKVNSTIQQLVKEIRDVRGDDRNLTKKATEIKQQISGYIDDVVKLLWQLKSDLHRDAEATVRGHREKLRSRLAEIESYNNRIKACRSRRDYENKVALLNSCSEYKQSRPFDRTLQYNLENNHVITEWQSKHGVYLQAPYPDSRRSEVSVSRTRTPPSTSDSEDSIGSGHLQIDFGSRNLGSQSQPRAHGEFQVQRKSAGNASQTPARRSTARLSKVHVTNQLESVKTLSFEKRLITCTVKTKYENVVLCDQKNSELLLFESDLKPLRSRHLSGRPGWGGSNSMRISEYSYVNYSREALRDSTLSYDEIESPSSLTVDEEDNIYVLDDSCLSIHMISGAGVYRGRVLVTESPIVQVTYLPSQNTFIIVSREGRQVDMYKTAEDEESVVEEF